MIPPITPGQSEDNQSVAPWKNTFNMRHMTLINIATLNNNGKNGIRTNNQFYRRPYSITSPSKCLDLLRKNIQDAINKDIDNVIKKYFDKFFQPAITNIKNNLGTESITDKHIRGVCRQILEDAKCMYSSKFMENAGGNHEQPPIQNETIDSAELNAHHPQTTKRKDHSHLLDLDHSTTKRHRTLTTTTRPAAAQFSHFIDNVGCKLYFKRDVPIGSTNTIGTSATTTASSTATGVTKWIKSDHRLNPNTLLIVGPKQALNEDVSTVTDLRQQTTDTTTTTTILQLSSTDQMNNNSVEDILKQSLLRQQIDYPNMSSDMSSLSSSVISSILSGNYSNT